MNIFNHVDLCYHTMLLPHCYNLTIIVKLFIGRLQYFHIIPSLTSLSRNHPSILLQTIFCKANVAVVATIDNLSFSDNNPSSDNNDNNSSHSVHAIPYYRYYSTCPHN